MAVGFVPVLISIPTFIYDQEVRQALTTLGNRELKQRRRQPENNDLIDWMRKNNRAARAARTCVQFFDVVCQTRTWNFQIYSFNDNVNTQRKSLIISIWHHGAPTSPPVAYNKGYEQKSNNHKIVMFYLP